jgi:hypothetical protein
MISAEPAQEQTQPEAKAEGETAEEVQTEKPENGEPVEDHSRS